MSTATIDAADDTTAILQAFRGELRDPAKPLSLLARFTVEGADGAIGIPAIPGGSSSTNNGGCSSVLKRIFGPITSRSFGTSSTR